METKSEVAVSNNLFFDGISWFFGILFLAIGFLNSFWGNDPFFGVFIILLSFAFYPPMNAMFTRKTGFKIPWYAKVLLGLFILWAALGVGELFDKVDMMLGNVSS